MCPQALFKPKVPKSPGANSPEVQAANLRERQRAASASGSASRILTGGMGDSSPAPTAGAMLTGQ